MKCQLNQQVLTMNLIEEPIDGSIQRGSVPILDEEEEKEENEEDRDNDDDESLRTAPLRLLSSLAKKAVEKARRKNYAKPVGRLSRGSLGDISLSDCFDDMNNLNSKIATESSFGECINDRHFSDHNGVVQDDMWSRLEPSFDPQYVHLYEMPEDQSSGPFSIQGHFSGDIFDEAVDTLFAFDVPRFLLKEKPSQITKLQPENFSQGTQEPIQVMNKTGSGARGRNKAKLKPRVLAMSRHGISYSSLTTPVFRKLILRFHNLRIKGQKASIKEDTLQAVLEASNRFFEQLGYDLRAYAQHAKRRRIEASDVIAVMKRQRHFTATRTTFSLSHQYLPKELLRDLRIWSSGKRPVMKKHSNEEAVERI